MDKYKEIARRIGLSFSVDNLLRTMDMPYNTKIMMVSLTPKFK